MAEKEKIINLVDSKRIGDFIESNNRLHKILCKLRRKKKLNFSFPQFERSEVWALGFVINMKDETVSGTGLVIRFYNDYKICCMETVGEILIQQVLE